MTIHNRVERYVPLDDMQVRTEGGDRIIDAYAAVFGVRQEIRDIEGHYLEEIGSQAFDRTLAQRSGRIQVIFNHGKTIHGTPAERFSMPYGTAVEMRADGKGLFTSTKVANTPLGDEVYELARSGAVRGQSFSGGFLKTDPQGRDRASGLHVKVRTEIALREYGLTPFPYYQDAHVVGVRNELAALEPEDLADFIAGLEEPVRTLVLGKIPPFVAADPGTDDTTDDPPDPGTDVTPTHDHQAARQRKLALLDLDASLTGE